MMYHVVLIVAFLATVRSQVFVSSNQPTLRPTMAPSASPTTTFSPSVAPTISPSAAPSYSFLPTVAPSQPTSQPTSSPSTIFQKVFSDTKRLDEETLPRFSQAAIGLGCAFFLMICFFIWFFYCRPPPPPNSQQLFERKKSMMRWETIAKKNAQYSAKVVNSPQLELDELGVGAAAVAPTQPTAAKAPRFSLTSAIPPNPSSNSTGARNRALSEEIIKLDLEEQI